MSLRLLDGMRLKTAVLRGLKTAWLDNENTGKEILLFLHGYMDTPAAWSPQVREFTDRYRIIVPFGRGIGESEPPADKKRYGAYSFLLDHLGLLRLCDPDRGRPVHIVGHDLGGVHAWMLASHPQPGFRTVTIINSVHPRQYLRRIFWPRQVLKSWYVAALQVPFFSERLLSLFHREVLQALAAEGWQAPRQDMGLEEFDQAALGAMEQYRQFVRDIPHFLRDAPGPIPLPVLVISSEKDRYLEEPSTPEFADLARDVTVRVVRGKHWVHREQPERINRLLADFWSRR